MEETRGGATSTCVLGEQQGSDRHRIFTQRSERNPRPWRECVHHKTIEFALDGRAQRFADQRQPAAEHDGFWMHEVRHVRKGEGEIFGDFTKDAVRVEIVLRKRCGEVFGLARCFASGQLNEQRIRCRLLERANLPIHRPTAAPLLDDGAGAIEPHMTDLRLAWSCTMKDLPVHNQTTADAAAERDVENGIAPLPGSA